MQESSGIVILNKNNNVLILLPSGRDLNKKWSVPKGKNEIGEDIIDAAVRELKEEAGIAVDKNKLVPLGTKVYLNKRKKINLFLAKMNELDDSYIPNMNWEHEKYLWLPPENAAELVHEAQVEFLMKLNELIK